jgi:hypothetical protein
MSGVELNKDKSMGAAPKLDLVQEERYQKLRQTISRMSQLSDNWDDRGSAAPTESVIQLAQHFLNQFQTYAMTPSRVAASVENGIGFTFEQSNKFAYIELLNSGEVVFLIDVKLQNSEAWEIHGGEEKLLLSSIQRIQNYLNG